MRARPRAGAALAALAMVATLGPAGARAAFERPSLDAESAALGGDVATAGDPVFGNPARLAGRAATPPLGARFDLSRPFGLAELSESQFSLAREGRRIGLGLGARRFGADGDAAYAEREARLALALAHDDAAIGLAVRGLEASGGGFAPVRSLAVDAAFLAQPLPFAEIGAVVEAVAGEVPGDPDGERRRAAVGLARSFGSAFRLSLEVQRRGEDPLAGVVGLECHLLSVLDLRAGIRQEPVAPSCGFSLRLAAGRVDVAVTPTEPLGTTVRLGVRLGGPR
ncbi:MAG: hypothetical protein U0167_19985 [bacterium]